MKKILFVTALCAAAYSAGAWSWFGLASDDAPAEASTNDQQQAETYAEGEEPKGSGWSWFGLARPDEMDTNTPRRLHILLQPANDAIEEAEDAALEGDADKAVDCYNKALDEIARVQRENPDRAEKPEFAPLRNKAAACKAAIDAIRFDQINRNVRAVAVTDTTELQKRYDRKHGIIRKETDAAEKSAEFAQAVTNELVAATKRVASAALRPEDEDRSWRTNDVTQLDFKGKYKMAWREVRAREFAAADVILEELQKEKPNDIDVLLLRAASQAGGGNRYAARRTLEKATRAHPRDHRAYYNLAYVTLALGESVEDARQYYEIGREFGGPRDARFEAKAKAAAIRAGERMSALERARAEAERAKEEKKDGK